MDTTKTIEQYLNELSSNSPTPGGGNVSALSGVLASSLGEMVCNLTIGKKKYLNVESEIIEIKKVIISLKEKFLELAQKDNEAFDKVMFAFKLPKENDEQKAERSRAIENATILAASIPNEVINYCIELLPQLDNISKTGNQNSLSDVGVALSLLSTAVEGAYLNVLINCYSLSDNESANEILILAGKNYLELKNQTQILINEIINKMKSTSR